MVPEGWNRIALEKIAEVRSGVAKGKKGLKTPIEVPYLRVANVQDGHVDLTEVKTIEIEEDKLERYSLKYGDVLMNEGGDYDKLGRGDVWLGQIEPCLHQNHVFAVRPNQDIVDSFFLAALAASNYGKTYFLSCAKRSTNLASINSTQIKEFPVLVPPLPEQKKIAQILSTWDKAITTTEQLLANSQQQKKALMQQLLSGKKRLLDENGVRFSGEWKEIRLKSVLREVKTRNKDNSIDRVLSVTNHSGFVLPEDQFSKRVASDDVSNYKVVKNGEYGYNPSRLNVGSFARLDSYEEGLLSPMYVVFSVNEKLLNSDYFMNWMSSNEAKQRISGSTQGSVRDSVGFDSLCGFPFKLPPMGEQQKIAAVLSTADQEIAALKQKLETLKQEKKALMQQLLTGKRRALVS